MNHSSYDYCQDPVASSRRAGAPTQENISPCAFTDLEGVRTIDMHKFNSMQQLIEDAFRRYSRILVLRVDLCYREGVRVNYHDIKIALNRLLNRKRANHLFDHYLGMAWKLEFASNWHIHTLWLFNGHHVQKDAYYAQKICEAWESVTQGQGYGYNCHLDKQRYKHVGIGMIHRQDEQARINLLQTASYLCKHDNYAQEQLPFKARTFGRSVVR